MASRIVKHTADHMPKGRKSVTVTHTVKYSPYPFRCSGCGSEVLDGGYHSLIGNKRSVVIPEFHLQGKCMRCADDSKK